jgi:hypothetical protein
MDHLIDFNGTMRFVVFLPYSQGTTRFVVFVPDSYGTMHFVVFLPDSHWTMHLYQGNQFTQLCASHTTNEALETLQF